MNFIKVHKTNEENERGTRINVAYIIGYEEAKGGTKIIVAIPGGETLYAIVTETVDQIDYMIRSREIIASAK